MNLPMDTLEDKCCGKKSKGKNHNVNIINIGNEVSKALKETKQMPAKQRKAEVKERIKTITNKIPVDGSETNTVWANQFDNLSTPFRVLDFRNKRYVYPEFY